MNDPKINIIQAHSFKEAYDVVPDEVKERVADSAYDYYSGEIEKLITSFNPKDTAFIVNALRCSLAALECAFPEDFKLAYQMVPEDMLQVMKYAAQEDIEYDRNQN